MPVFVMGANQMAVIRIKEGHLRICWRDILNRTTQSEEQHTYVGSQAKAGFTSPWLLIMYLNFWPEKDAYLKLFIKCH